ncbi:hypothetical protein VNO78_31619 [Psophocarpus tetragonolobus]|uniref:Uncharacterized protein n=1 Tax=Psophocarpus tetragonolobus TaxID=3891 RepID=A0AAN9RZD8_PSOTE
MRSENRGIFKSISLKINGSQKLLVSVNPRLHVEPQPQTIPSHLQNVTVGITTHLGIRRRLSCPIIEKITSHYKEVVLVVLLQGLCFLPVWRSCIQSYIKTQMSSGRKAGKPKEEEQDGVSVHSPCKPPPSSASSLPKEQSQVELELRLLEALEIYPPMKLQGVHRNFVLYGLMEFLRRKFDRQFSSEEVLQLLDRFYNLEMLKSDDDEIDLLTHEEEFSLPQSYFVKEEP